MYNYQNNPGIKIGKTVVAFPPGCMLSDILTQLQVDERWLANKLNISLEDASNLLIGRKIIGDSLSKKLSNLFRTPENFWAQLEKAYRKDLRKIAEEEYDERN